MKYFVLEYLEKGELLDYISSPKQGLSELYSKLIFSKILNGIQSCHNMGVCHRDIKLENILVTNDYSPKLCDFGFATKNEPDLSEYIGTQDHAAPEVISHKPYDGFKADIFSLGVTLISLTTNKQCFRSASKNDSNYRYIILNKLDRFWGRVDRQINAISQELKNLFIKMISFNPKDRPDIKQILESAWMKELNDMNQEQLVKLEKEVKDELEKREVIVKAEKEKIMEINEQNSQEFSQNRSSNDYEYFQPDLKPKVLPPEKKIDNYIKFKGCFNPCLFMNKLCDKLKQKFEECFIEPNKNNFAFKIIFEEEDEEDEEELTEEMIEEFKKLGINDDNEIDDEDNIKGKEIVIKVKLYYTGIKNLNYLLRFEKIKGNRIDYLDKVEKISNLVKSII